MFARFTSSALYFFLSDTVLKRKLHFRISVDSSVGIANRYGLSGPGIESRWGRDIPQPSRPAQGAHRASYTMSMGSFPGAKRPRRGAGHSPLSSAGVKRKSRAMPILPFWAFASCHRVIFTLPLWICCLVH